MALLKQEKQQLVKEVRRLRRQGYNNQGVAQFTGKSVNVICQITTQLLASGKIKDLRAYNKGTPKKGKINWKDIESKEVKTFIQMVKDRATLEQIGQTFGLTRERARQVNRLIAQEHGVDVFEQEESFLTLAQVVDFLDLPDNYTKNRIRNICASGSIVCRRRSSSNRSSWIIRESELQNLQQLLSVREHECTCGICQQPFFVENGLNRKTCSPECSQEQNRRLYNSYVDSEPALDSLGSWYKDLWQKLQTHTPPENEKGWRIGKAMKKTGLTQMQLHWLRKRKIITVWGDCAKSWRGRPVALYAVSELKLAVKVFKAWKSRQNK